MKTTIVICVLTLFPWPACSNQPKGSQAKTASAAEEEILMKITKIVEEHTRSVEAETDLFVLFLDGSDEVSEDFILIIIEYCSLESLTLDVVWVDEVGFSRSQEHGIEVFPSGVFYKEGEYTVFEGRGGIQGFLENEPEDKSN